MFVIRKNDFMETTVIITAAGNSDRWGNYLNTVKHLAPIPLPGQTVIGRTIQMLKNAGIDNIFVATENEKIIETVAKDVRIIRPANCESLANTILSSHEKWTQRTIVMLGDVFFSQQCLETILRCKDNVKFFGIDRHSEPKLIRTRRSEIFALSFNISAKEFMLNNLLFNSFFARARDKGSLRIPCLKKSMMGKPDYLKTLWRVGYPPKPPLILRKAGFKKSLFWRIGRSLFSKHCKRRTRLWGKLWGLYLIMTSIDPYAGIDYKWPAGLNGFMKEIDDITQDIDRKEDYDTLLKKLLQTNPAYKL